MARKLRSDLIPPYVPILGNRWKIKIDTKLCTEREVYGLCSRSVKTIYLMGLDGYNTEGKVLTEAEQYDAFWHELKHAVNYHIGIDETEEQTDAFGCALASINLYLLRRATRDNRSKRNKPKQP